MQSPLQDQFPFLVLVMTAAALCFVDCSEWVPISHDPCKCCYSLLHAVNENHAFVDAFIFTVHFLCIAGRPWKTFNSPVHDKVL